MNDILRSCCRRTLDSMLSPNWTLISDDGELSSAANLSDNMVFFRMFIIQSILTFIDNNPMPNYETYKNFIYTILNPWLTHKPSEAIIISNNMLKDFNRGAEGFVIKCDPIRMTQEQYDAIQRFISEGEGKTPRKKRRSSDDESKSILTNCTYENLLKDPRLGKYDIEFLKLVAMVLVIKVNLPSDVSTVTIHPKVTENSTMLNFTINRPMHVILILLDGDSNNQMPIATMGNREDIAELQISLHAALKAFCKKLLDGVDFDNLGDQRVDMHLIMAIYEMLSAPFNSSVACTQYLKHQYPKRSENELSTVIWAYFLNGAFLFNKDKTSVRARWYQSSTVDPRGLPVTVLRDSCKHLKDYLNKYITMALSYRPNMITAE